MLRDEQNTEVVVEERVLERCERDRDEHELTGRGRSRERHPIGASGRGAGERQRRLNQREAQREDQRELADLGDHSATAVRALAFASASVTSGGS